MAWDADAKLLAIKAIGTVESNLKYDAINYVDAITVGIMQWYGTRAADLLLKVKAADPALWATHVAQSLDDDLSSNAATSGSYWTRRYLTRGEGTSLSRVLTAATGVQVQNAQTIADFEDYRGSAESRGLDAETNTNAFIYYCMLYHQSPLNANRVLNNAGANPTLDRLHSLALNNAWYSGYKTRLNTARSIILSGDTSGVPDWEVDPSQPPEDGGDSGTGLPDAGGVVQHRGAIRSVELVGDALHVHTAGGVVICQPTSTGRLWLAGGLAQPDTGPVVPPPSGSDEPPIVPPGDPGVAEALVQFLIARISKYRYTQGAGRDNPDTSGKTDCSALMKYAYRQVAGITLGANTVEQQRNGTVVWSNLPGNSFGAGPGNIPPVGLLQKGDLCYFANDTSYQRVRHVEMFMGSDHNNQLIGWGGANPPGVGPYLKTSYNGYMTYWRWHIVRRIL